jgi:hypothetical protein
LSLCISRRNTLQWTGAYSSLHDFSDQSESAAKHAFFPTVQKGAGLASAQFNLLVTGGSTRSETVTAICC